MTKGHKDILYKFINFIPKMCNLSPKKFVLYYFTI